MREVMFMALFRYRAYTPYLKAKTFPLVHNSFQLIFRYGNLIGISIKENGNIADPKHNTKLAKVIADAQSENVSKVQN